MKETELYPPLESYLEANGYEVYAEVKGTDVIARKNNEIIAIELKTSINLTLILQAVERQSTADNVYLAVPLPRSLRSSNRKLKRISALLRRLGLGLIYVNPSAPIHKIQIVLHPGPYIPPSRRKKREAILREISARIGNYNTGGSTRTRLMTAYRQRAIQVATCLDRSGPASPALLKKKGCPADTGQILLQNYYGWFERVEKGVYRLHSEGKKALCQYEELVEHFKKKFTE